MLCTSVISKTNPQLPTTIVYNLDELNVCFSIITYIVFTFYSYIYLDCLGLAIVIDHSNFFRSNTLHIG